MRGLDLVWANGVALAVGLALALGIHSPRIVGLAGLVLAGFATLQIRSRPSRVGENTSGRSPVWMALVLVLNGLYGCFFAVLLYYLILAFTHQIGYPYR